MTIEEKLVIVADFVGRPLTDEEKDGATKLLNIPPEPFSGSYSPAYVARRITMLEKAGRRSA